MSDEEDLWRAMASPWRRQLLDLLRGGPRTTGDLVDAIPELSRYAVMQHLAVLVKAGVVVVRRRGRHRYNHLNPVPLRRWYERWVRPMADLAASELLALERAVNDEGDEAMATVMDELRTVRIETELRFRAPAARVFDAITGDTLRWFPHSYGEDRTQRVVIEPRVGGVALRGLGRGGGVPVRPRHRVVPTLSLWPARSGDGRIDPGHELRNLGGGRRVIAQDVEGGHRTDDR